MQNKSIVTDTPPKKAADQAVQLFNDWQDISLLQIVAVVVGAWLAIAVVRRVIPFLAERGPNQLRLYLLAIDGRCHIVDHPHRPQCHLPEFLGYRRWS